MKDSWMGGISWSLPEKKSVGHENDEVQKTNDLVKYVVILTGYFQYIRTNEFYIESVVIVYEQLL